MDVKGKVAIVTGASSGIGEATARLFAQKGAKIALVARTQNKLKKLSQELLGSVGFVCDMSSPQDIKKMVASVQKKFGKIDILINCAGQGYDAAVVDITVSAFTKIFNLDLMGPIIAMQEVIPIMKKQGEGSILNVSSGTALMVLAGMSPYASIKQALAKVSLTAREELAKDNISVCVIYPYITSTNFEKNTIRSATEDYADNNHSFELPQPDSPEFVAQKILEGIEKNTAEIFAHTWMKGSH